MRDIINLKKTLPIISNRLHNPVLYFQREINNAFNSLYHMFQIPFTYFTEIENLLINPSVDIINDHKNFKVEVELPGMSEPEIKVSISDRILSIQGKKEISKKDEGKNYISREINYGHYERHITLPDYVDIDKEAKASFKKGMLWVTFQKKETTNNHHKEIKVEKINENADS